jgi:arylsulfatase A-like enzyme
LILADDMGIGDMSFINQDLKRTTPNLDKLVDESVWFIQAYSSSPVCSPARATLLTGLNPHQTCCITLNKLRFPTIQRVAKRLTTIADIFSDNDYVTGFIGKWHTGVGEGFHPMVRGFQEFEGFDNMDLQIYWNYGLDINRTFKEFALASLFQNYRKKTDRFRIQCSIWLSPQTVSNSYPG